MRLRIPRRFATFGCLVLLSLACLGAVGLRRFAMQSFFLPDLHVSVEPGTPADQGLAYEEVQIHVEKGVRLNAWWIPQPGPAHAVIFLHGNAQDRTMPTRIRVMKMLSGLGYHVLALDFRGYGGSTGKPTHRGVIQDTRAAIHWVSSREEVLEVALYGHSLGGSVSLCAATRPSPVKAVVTQGAFDSAREMGRRAASRLAGERFGRPLGSLLVRSPIEPVDCLKSVDAPVLLVHGSHDYVIPLEAAIQLYEAGDPGRVQLWAERFGLHIEAIDVFPQRYRTRVGEFLREHLGGEGAGKGFRESFADGELRLECDRGSGLPSEIEVFAWGGGDYTWSRHELVCLPESIPLPVAHRVEGVSVLPALGPIRPNMRGRGYLNRFGIEVPGLAQPQGK